MAWNRTATRSAALSLMFCAIAQMACGQAPAPSSSHAPPSSQVQHPPLTADSPQLAAMQADLNRLVELARQLKGTVDKTRRDELNVKVIRQADEIEKLARSARSRLR